MNLNDLLKMLSNPEEFKRRMLEIQERMASIQATGSSGGGMVKITLNGRMEAVSCEIAPEVVDPAEVAILQDLVRAAVNDAFVRLKESAGGPLGAQMPGGGGLDPDILKSFLGDGK